MEEPMTEPGYTPAVAETSLPTGRPNFWKRWTKRLTKIHPFSTSSLRRRDLPPKTTVGVDGTSSATAKQRLIRKRWKLFATRHGTGLDHNYIAASEERRGLFGLPELQEPRDFSRVAHEAIRECDSIRRQLQHILSEFDKGNALAFPPQYILFLLDRLSLATTSNLQIRAAGLNVCSNLRRGFEGC
jgi:hypothetical protein